MDLNGGAIQIENVIAHGIVKVVGKQLINGELKYQVAVKGLSGPLWFPADALVDSSHLIRKFERKTAGGGNMGHGKSASKTNRAEMDRRFDLLLTGVEANQKLLANAVPRITKLEDDIRVLKDEVRVQGQKLGAVESQAGERAGPSALGVFAAAANGHVQAAIRPQQQEHGQGPREVFKVPCGNCGKLLTPGYVKRHFSQNKCGQRPGRPAKRGRQE